MKLSFFAAALLGVVGFQNVQAARLESNNIDFSDFEFAEIEAEGEGNTLADADCEETVNGVTLRLSTPECE